MFQKVCIYIFKFTILFNKLFGHQRQFSSTTIHFSTAFFRWSFAVGDQKVCILLIGTFKALQQTFWNTNSGGKYRSASNKTSEVSGITLDFGSFLNQLKTSEVFCKLYKYRSASNKTSEVSGITKHLNKLNLNKKKDRK